MEQENEAEPAVIYISEQPLIRDEIFGSYPTSVQEISMTFAELLEVLNADNEALEFMNCERIITNFEKAAKTIETLLTDIEWDRYKINTMDSNRPIELAKRIFNIDSDDPKEEESLLKVMDHIMLQKTLWNGPIPEKDRVWRKTLSDDNKEAVKACLESLKSHVGDLKDHFVSFELECPAKPSEVGFFNISLKNGHIGEEDNGNIFQITSNFSFKN